MSGRTVALAVVLGVLAFLAACGPAPRPARPTIAPWSELAGLPARAELAIAVADASAAAARLADGREVGGDELAAWLAPRFAGRSWPLEDLGGAGLDAHGPVAAARLDRTATTMVRTARVTDAAALGRAVDDAVRAAGASPTRWMVGAVEILAVGDDALVIRDGRAFFVASGARSQRDRAAVEIAAGDGGVLGDEIAALIAALGPGEMAVAARGLATAELVATENRTRAAAAVLSMAPDALISRVAVSPAPSAAQVELGLPVDSEPEPGPESALEPWPAMPHDENPDVPLSAAYQQLAAQVTALDAEGKALTRTLGLSYLERAAVIDRAFVARTTWRRQGGMAIADLRIALPGGGLATAVARARQATSPMLAAREAALARYRAALAEYQALQQELTRVRARDVAAHDRAPR